MYEKHLHPNQVNQENDKITKSPPLWRAHPAGAVYCTIYQKLQKDL